jgi:superfamily II DNA or RNA helicase
MKIKLRDYQEEGIFLIKTALSGALNPKIEYRAGHQGRAKKVIYVLSTGAGKTATYSAIANGAASKGKRVLILEHRKELIYQASQALARLGLNHKIIAPDSKINEIKRRHINELNQHYVRHSSAVAVASVQTLARRMDWLREFNPDIVITDEAHHRVAGTWERIGLATESAIEIGVTATPCRTNGDGLGQVYQAMVFGPPPGHLIDHGYLAPFRVFAPPPKASFDGVHITEGDYDRNELAEIIDKPTITGDAIEHYLKYTPNQPGIVFCCNIRHAGHVAQQFSDAGIKAFVIHGGMDDNERDKLIGGLADGSVELLVSVDLISEGTDLPVAVVAIMLRRTLSLSLFLQMCGRVGRPLYADGYDLSVREQRLAAIAMGPKPFGVIIDHVGNVLRPGFGLPQREREWTLAGRPKRRGGNKEEAEPPTNDLQCPSCYQVHTIEDGRACANSKGMPEGTVACVYCGHVYDPPKDKGPKMRSGELREIVESEEDLKKMRERMEQGRAQTREALIAMGMSQRRAEHILQARREKERLQRELREMLAIWSQRNSRAAVDAFGFRASDIEKMKPKALREAMESISVAIFARTGDGS